MSDLSPVLKRLYESTAPSQEDLVFLLSLNDPAQAAQVFSFADRVRREHMGEGIFLRGIVEFSNFCARGCSYCGLNKHHQNLARYRLTREEILAAVAVLVSCGLVTVVLQSGEDEGIGADWLAGVVRDIRRRFDIAVTLCVGERPDEDYRLWREAGADRYLLKIETSDPSLYETLHPGMSFQRRLACLKTLKRLGYQTGCGNIIGLKGQTGAHIARDIFFFKREEFDMIGIGPFIPHPATALAHEPGGAPLLTLLTLALTRIVTRNAHLPATTALGSLRRDFRPEALAAGANVLMPNFTPAPYRRLYEIYPNKRCVGEAAGGCRGCLEEMAGSLDRRLDYGRGDSLKKRGTCMRVN